MSAILAYVDLTIVGYVATFVVTLVFSQKIKDFFAGVPADMRAGLQAAEAKLKADVANYRASLVAKIVPAATTVTAIPVAPVAPVPATPAAL